MNDDMKLPTGKTCADCVHLRRCVGLGYTKPENTTCDFAPSRFRLKVNPGTPGTSSGTESTHQPPIPTRRFDQKS